MSTLYEKLYMDSPQRSPENDFAIHHYHIAIQLVINFRTQNGHLDAVLVACIVFMSIEVFNGNPKKAVIYYNHGMSILRSYKPYLPLINHVRELNVYVLLFSDISGSATVEENDSSLPDGSFRCPSQARKALNWLVYQSMAVATFVDQSLYSNLPNSHAKIDSMRQIMNKELDDWTLAAMPFRSDLLALEHRARFHMLEARFWVCKIWVNSGVFEGSIHNGYEESFQRIVQIITEVDLSNTPGLTKESDPDAGFPAVLHFVITKCRSAELRLGALSLLKAQCRSDETLWDLKILYETATKATEGSHGIL
ncbi:C6 zinc finger domain-containing protein [Penicillium herquei]|nr:C6 zinc finger domain-containing protein [Penicillium herquei]